MTKAKIDRKQAHSLNFLQDIHTYYNKEVVIYQIRFVCNAVFITTRLVIISNNNYFVSLAVKDQFNI